MSECSSRNELMVFICIASVALLSATVAQAVDGRLEINQTCATMTGCGPGADAAGFPVVIDTSGSYVLTSDLVLPGPSTDGIFVSGVDLNVDIDLNGFAIDNPAGGSGGGDGIAVANGGDSPVRVRNGFIRRVGGRGINGAQRVENVVVQDCGGTGIATRFEHTSTVLDSEVSGCGGSALQRSTSALSCVLIARNQFVGNASSWNLTNPGKIEAIGENFCDDDLCRSGPRKFYLTNSTVDGANALTACDDGFHLASRWEIHDVTSLVYDLGRGFHWATNTMDGPPSNAAGWINTGRAASIGTEDIPGWSNCDNHSSASASHFGTRAQLDAFGAADPAIQAAPWDLDTALCSTGQLVWCVQD